MRQLLHQAAPLAGMLLALGSTACRADSGLCSGQRASRCDDVVGVWEGTGSAGTSESAFALSIDADTCDFKGSIELGPDVAAPLDGALCTAQLADIAFDSSTASGQGQASFDAAAGEMTGEVSLVIKVLGTNFSRGEVRFVLAGAPRLAPCGGRCDDGNPCTDDLCEGQFGCVNRNNSDDCDDGDPCTDNDFCSAGACRSVTARTCNDDNPCTADACVASTGACVHEPLTSSSPSVCDDADPCTEPDTCVVGACTGADSGVCVCGNGRCDADEDCDACAADCDRFDGLQQETFCCGDGEAQLAEGDGAVCDDNY